MFQNMISSSPSSVNYNFSIDADGNVEPMQHYNRVFIMKDPTEDTRKIMCASGRIITAATAVKRKRDEERACQNDMTAVKILKHNGVDVAALNTASPAREAVVKKVNGVDTNWNILIENHSLYGLDPETIEKMISEFDLDAYNTLIGNSFEKNWRNHVPNADGTFTETDFDKDDEDEE